MTTHDIAAVNVGPERRPSAPGEFQWRFAWMDDHGKHSRPATLEDIPNEMWLCEPDRNFPANIPLKGHPYTDGDTWEWDGNRDQPTLTPSIDASKYGGWHGYLTAGKLVDA